MTSTSLTPPEFRKISNSEATDWNTCKSLYHKSYVRNLAPKLLKGPMATGNVGHLGLERYYKGVMAGESHDVAAANALERVKQEIIKKEYDLENILKAYECLERFFAYYGDETDTWEPLAIEQEYSVPIPSHSNFDLTGKIDALFRHKITGQIVLRDWKFTYDFWKEDKLVLRGQFPKYILFLRHNGINVDKVVIDQLRYRELKNKEDHSLYLRRSDYNPTHAKIRNVVRDHITTSVQIMEYRALPPAEQEKRAVKLLVDPICKGCRFKELCKLELDDGDTTLFVKDNFKHNDYGYNEEVVA